MQLTLDCPEARSATAALRRTFPQLRPPLLLPRCAEPVLAVDRNQRLWLFGPLDNDPQRTPDGHFALPRGELRRLRELAASRRLDHAIDPATSADTALALWFPLVAWWW